VWTEANRSNLFVVRDGVFCTPPDDGRILQGVTRTMMLEAARSAGVPVHDRDPVAVGPVEEMYLAATLKELAPVVELDGAPGAGPGPVGARVLAAFREAARRASESG
jgi:branched-subunit amino acid aminotransferase/4-amino-4-deoxychorismate lyase